MVSSHEELANGDTSPLRAADGVRSFAGELLAPLFAAEGNVVVSPYSVTTAMHLAMLGASGETLTASGGPLLLRRDGPRRHRRPHGRARR